MELGEIQAAISSYSSVKQSVVTVREAAKQSSKASKKYLIGYFVSNEDISEQILRKYLQTKLPLYMIPNRLISIDSIPITDNGKLDEKRLPHVEFGSNIDQYEAPMSEVQATLCNIWSDIFEIPAEKIGINDDFFNLGGDSIMALWLKNAVSEAFSIDITTEIFQYRTIKALAEYLGKRPTGVQPDWHPKKPNWHPMPIGRFFGY